LRYRAFAAGHDFALGGIARLPKPRKASPETGMTILVSMRADHGHPDIELPSMFH
jgi:hypothetical protein